MATIAGDVLTISGPIQHKRATQAVWSSQNPLLLPGELGIETDTQKLKVGDGEHRWNELNYVMQGLIDGLLTKVEELEEHVSLFDDTASDESVDEMFDEVFTGKSRQDDVDISGDI